MVIATKGSAAEQTRMREETSVGHHPVIWSYRYSFDVPCPVQYLDRLRHVEGALFEGLTQLHCLHDAWCVGQKDSTGMHGFRRMGNDLPWLWEIENNTVEIGFINTVVAISQFAPITIEDLSAEKRFDIFFRAISKVLSQLVAHDVRSSSQHRHRERPGADT